MFLNFRGIFALVSYKLVSYKKKCILNPMGNDIKLSRPNVRQKETSYRSILLFYSLKRVLTQRNSSKTTKKYCLNFLVGLATKGVFPSLRQSSPNTCDDRTAMY